MQLMALNYAKKDNPDEPVLGIHDEVSSSLGIDGKVIAIRSSYTPEQDDKKVFVRLDSMPHDPLYSGMLTLLKRDERNQEAILRGEHVTVRDVVRVTHPQSSRYGQLAHVQSIGSKGWSVTYGLSDASIAQEIVEREANYRDLFLRTVNEELDDNQHFWDYLKSQVKRTRRIPSSEVAKEEYLAQVLRDVNIRLNFQKVFSKIQELERRRVSFFSRHEFELAN